MSFGGLILTNAGRNKMAAAVSEGNALQFTKIQLGDASYNGSYKSKTQLSNMVMELPITRVQRENGGVAIECDWNSKQAPKAFYLREIGIIGNGVLCYYDNARDGDAEFIDPESEVVTKQKRFRFKISVTDDAEVVTMVPSGLYALKEELDADVEELEEKIDGKVDKTGNVSDTTVTFTPASVRANISTGEKLSTLLGKIAKWLADLKTVAFTGKYEDLTGKPTSMPANGGTAETISETLPVSKGGTGKTTAKEAAKVLVAALDSDGNLPQDYDKIVMQDTGGNVEKSPLIQLANYIKTRLSTVATSGNYNDLVNKPEKYTHPTSAGNKHIPTGGSSGQILRWSADGTAAWGADNNTTYGAATQSAQGLMSANDKTKLDGIASGANAYSLPAASPTVRGGVKTGYVANGKNYPVQVSNEQMYVNVPWTDTNTWRGIQNNLTSDSTNESLSAAQGKALKALVDGKAASSHTHSYLPLSGGTVTGDLKAKGKITQNASTATGTDAAAFGDRCKASGKYAFVAGSESESGATGTVAMGCGCKAPGNYGAAFGYATESSYFQMVIGAINRKLDGPSSQGAKSGTAFVIGNGTSNTDRSNAFRVTGAGAAYACSAFNSSGADYAEFFEWEDGNTENEDRRGYFVTLSGDKIKPAKPGDYILGVVSANPTVIGNSDEDWTGRYIKDEFGSYIEETYEYDEISVDENGEETTTRKTGITWKQNPDYDPEMTYIQRADRAEWDAVGMMGVLPVRDDGSCEVNGYCTVAEGGIATACSRSVTADVYRVIGRSGENVVKIVVK